MPEVDIVVPTVPGREESLERFLSSLKRCTPQSIPLQEIVIEDSESCGWGWHRGLRASRAPYVLLACDDQEMIGPEWAQTCIETVDEGKLPCPRVWMPGGRIESQGGDMDVFAHIINRPQKDRTAVNYTTIPFMSREQADAIGMLPELHYCTDTWVSYRGRQLGYETVLRHGFDVLHHREMAHRGAGMSQSDRDAMDEKRMRKELATCESSAPAA
jgi:hypothetical protein